MAVTPKPQRAQKDPAPDVEALINKGGSIAGQNGAEKKRDKVFAINLRVPVEIAGRVAQAVEARPLKIPRQTWILEAILEKLEREENPV